MAKTASKKQSAKKTKKKAESSYYIVNRINRLSEQLTEFATKYNDKLLAPSIGATRATIDLIRTDPKQALGKIKKDSLELMEDVREGVENKIKDWKEEGKDLLKELIDDPRRMAGDYLKEGRNWTDSTFSNVIQVLENLTQDSKTVIAEVRSDKGAIISDLFQTGKKTIESFQGKNMVSAQVEKAVEWLPKPFKLTTKSDLEKLVDAMENLNEKVERLKDRLPG
jgi:hypothetical protein